MVLNAALKIKPICYFYVVILVLQNCKISSHFFTPYVSMFLTWRRSVVVSFSLFHFVLRKPSCFEAFIKNMIPHMLFLCGGGPSCLLSECTISMSCFHYSFSLHRFKCYALQEESNAIRTLLQPGSTPDDSGAGSPPNSLCAVVWANIGWQCQQVCLDRAMQ